MESGQPSGPPNTIGVHVNPGSQSPPHWPFCVVKPHGWIGPSHEHEMPSIDTHCLAFAQSPLQNPTLPPQLFAFTVVVVKGGHVSDVVVTVDVEVVVNTKVTVVVTTAVDVVVNGVVTVVVTIDVDVVVTVDVDVDVVAPGTDVDVVPGGAVVDVVPGRDVEVVNAGPVVDVIVVELVVELVVVNGSQQSPSMGPSTWTSRFLHSVRTLMAPLSVPSFLARTQRTSAGAFAAQSATTTIPTTTTRMRRPYASDVQIANSPPPTHVAATVARPYPPFVTEPASLESDVEELASFLRGWADLELRGYAPLYESLARALAEDRPLLERIVGLVPRGKLVAVLFFAAVRRLLLDDPNAPLARCYAAGDGDPWPLFRDFVTRRFDDIAALVRRRTIQTNEVGRTSAVFPAVGILAREVARPLGLVEVGASAGLNLNLDRFAYDVGGIAAGDLASPVRLSCDLFGTGRPPLPARPVPIASRVGIDLAPIDLDSTDACLWLEACVWPGRTPRAERLRAAIELARRHRPHVLRGDALDLLPGILSGLPTDTVPCIVSTWVLAYLDRAARTRLAEHAAAASMDRPVAWITLEYAGVPPWLPAPPDTPPDAPGATNLLSLTTWRSGVASARTLAWVHAHGAWMAWLPDAPAAV